MSEHFNLTQAASGIAGLQKEIIDLRARAEKAERELAEVSQWVHDLQSGMYVNCVYCGHRYGPGETTPVTMADALKAHIEQCPKHPMSALKRERDQAVADAAGLYCALEDTFVRYQSDKWNDCFCAHCQWEWRTDPVSNDPAFKPEEPNHSPTCIMVTKHPGSTLLAKMERMKGALKNISGGCFEGASTLAIAGEWRAMYQALQTLAATALKEDSK